jgi:hypothetical protein
MVNFDVDSLFTKKLIREVLDLPSQHFEQDILRLFHHVLASFSGFGGQFYD